MHAKCTGHFTFALQRRRVDDPGFPRQVDQRRVMTVKEVRGQYVLIIHDASDLMT